MLDAILDFFECNPIKLEFFNNSYLPHLRSQSLRYRTELEFYQKDIESQQRLVKVVTRNFNEQISKIIFDHIIDIGHKTYIDFRNSPVAQSPYTIAQSIIRELEIKPQKNILSNNRIASELDLNYGFTKNLILNTIPYKVGGFIGKDFWIDPFLKWDSNFIILFDEIRVDICNQKCYLNNNSPNFGSGIDFCVDFKFEVLNPEIFYIFDNTHDVNWKELQPIFLQNSREAKLNQILDEPTEFRPNNQFGI
jgi:hypothetical protein